jgi:hypothetical protein
MLRIYKPYLDLQGDYNYLRYCAKCSDLGMKPDMPMTFYERVGFVVVAMSTTPTESAERTLQDFSAMALKIGMMLNQDTEGAIQVGVDRIEVKPCCGGGKVL